LIEGYAVAGRMAKCRQLIREAESTGVMLDKRLVSSLSEMDNGHP
jgi:pentatricopeptide repeat protein